MNARARATFSRAAILSAAFVLLAGPVEARAEWIAAGYLGGARTAAAPVSIAQPGAGTDVTLSPVRYRAESFTPPLYYGGRVTWFTRRLPWLGVEAEFIHLKAYAESERETHASGRHHGSGLDRVILVSAVIEHFSISHGLNLVLFNGVVRRRLGGKGLRSRVSLVGRLGAGPTVPHAESTIDGISREAYAWGASALQAAAGADIRVTRRVGVLAEYKFTRSRQDVAVDRGRVRGLFASHHAVVGLSGHF